MAIRGRDQGEPATGVNGSPACVFAPRPATTALYSARTGEIRAAAGDADMYTRQDLEAAAANGVIDAGTLGRLLDFLSSRAATPAPTTPPVRFDLSHMLWYAGALIILASMGLFSTLAFSMMGGMALTITAIAYALAFVFAGDRLWSGRDLRTPGGLLIACAVGMAPLAVYGVQDWMGWWNDGVKPGTLRDFHIWIKGGWVPMEVATLVAAMLALRKWPFPFIVAVASVALWYLTMDLARLIADSVWAAGVNEWNFRRSITQWFGLAVIVFAWIIDMKKRSGDFGFWLHMAGIAAFWGAVTAQSSNSEVAKAIYCLMNVGLLMLAVYFSRRVYAVFGTIGVMLYLGHLAEKVFKNSLLFPFALSLLGIGLIAVGIHYFRNRDRIEKAFEAALPPGLKALRPVHAREASLAGANAG